MGSFYSTCMVTRQTISDGQEMYAQFMVPSAFSTYNRKNQKGVAQMFVDGFLRTAKEKGVEFAIKTWDDTTSNWGTSEEMQTAPKGLIVSDGSLNQWVPFGPAIRGYYDDYGRIQPADDEDSKERVRILEAIIGLPFETIQEVATDDRWLRYGFREGDTMWALKDVDKDMPDWQLEICKQLSVTHFHGKVYDELINPNFDPESRDGIATGIDTWREDKIKKIEKLIPQIDSSLLSEPDEDPITRLERRWKLREFSDGDIYILRQMGPEMCLVYLACIAREKLKADWLIESTNLAYGLSSLNLSLEQSLYGSQYSNWEGIERIRKAFAPKMEEELRLRYE